jgi:hypothetical protein
MQDTPHSPDCPTAGRVSNRRRREMLTRAEYATKRDDRNKLHSFAYVRREDGGEIPDGHYVFLDELGERSLRWRKWKGKWQFE